MSQVGRIRLVSPDPAKGQCFRWLIVNNSAGYETGPGKCNTFLPLKESLTDYIFCLLYAY